MGKLSDICKAENIRIGFIDCNELYDGKHTLLELGGAVALRLGEKKCILVDKDAGQIEKRIAVSHELAHHIFGHLDKPEITNAMEDEARLFSVVYTAMSLIFTGVTVE